MEKLHLKDFKAFYGEFEIECPNKNNLLLFGENGSGKTSIFEAIRYVFYKDEIEKVDSLMTQDDKNQKLEEIRRRYRNDKSQSPFEIIFNNNNLGNVPKDDYQVFMLNRFYKEDRISIDNILRHIKLPIDDISVFLVNNINLIKENVNLELSQKFHEPIEIAAIDASNEYTVTLKNKDTGLSRNNEISKFFNEAIINLVQLLIWFSSVQLAIDKNKKQLIVLDDIITSLDASNRSLMMHYILTTFGSTQLIILTHDYSLFNITYYIISHVIRQKETWNQYKLYIIDNKPSIEIVGKIRTKDLEMEYQKRNVNYGLLGNKVRKCFEERLHELSFMLSIGNLEETKGIIRRIADHKTVYWKNNSTLQDLLSEIEALIPSITDQNIRNAINSKIGDYKLKNAQKLQDIVCNLRLYQKVAMHPLSHVALGVPHYSKKDVRQSIILLEKLDDCIKSIIDGRI